MSRVFVFPGQGSQSVGMVAALAAGDPVVEQTFHEASQVLGYDLWKLVVDGPAETLNETTRTQPAMLAAGVATWRCWRNAGGAMPDAVCGHSLGEFAALTAAGVLEFTEAMRLVRHRSELMQDAVPIGVGAIAAVLGLEDEAIAAACAEAAGGEVVEPVNFNAPGQMVIAGHAGAVNRALEACKARGAKRAVLLPMSVPAHSSLMRPAAESFAALLQDARLAAPRMAFWSPVDGAAHTDVQDIRSLLQRQLASPVRWAELIRRLAAAGFTQFIECGPGKVLTSLNRRIEKRPEIHCLALQDMESLRAVQAQLQ
ncbi:MAG: ACP S-malonyltransferase [Steroidobacteraceae bacterium]